MLCVIISHHSYISICNIHLKGFHAFSQRRNSYLRLFKRVFPLKIKHGTVLNVWHFEAENVSSTVDLFGDVLKHSCHAFYPGALPDFSVYQTNAYKRLLVSRNCVAHSFEEVVTHHMGRSFVHQNHAESCGSFCGSGAALPLKLGFVGIQRFDLVGQ